VSVDDRCEDESEPTEGAEEGSAGGDIRERMVCRQTEPRRARPYMYPKCNRPEKRRKVPNRRKKSIGPARSESSIMCWSM
jgi:hypothetical protein